MYTPFGSLMFSHSVSSTMSRSSTSTTTTTTQLQHEVTKKSQWSNAAAANYTSGQHLREKMANSFANPAAKAATDSQKHENRLDCDFFQKESKSSNGSSPKKSAYDGMLMSSNFDKIQFENEQYLRDKDAIQMIMKSPLPRAIKKACALSGSSPNKQQSAKEDYQELLCQSVNENMKLQEDSQKPASSDNTQPPSVASGDSSSANTTRSSSIQPPEDKPQKKAARNSNSNSNKPRRSNKLPLRSRNIDMEAFLKQASTRNLYMNPADRMYSSAKHKSSGDSVTPAQQFNPTSPPPPTPNTSDKAGPRPNYCSFCKNNGEDPVVYMSHPLKDSLGKNACPILRNYECPKCHESGDYAHTNKYCPLTQRRQKESKIRQHLSTRA